MLNYCNIPSKLSPKISSMPFFHLWHSLSTISSSFSMSSLMNGSISGNRPSHSSPSRQVKLCSQSTVVNLVCLSSLLMFLSRILFISR